MKRYFLLFIGYLLLFFSCAEKNVSKLNYYFDVKSFFEEETKQLNATNPQVNKKVFLNNEKETKNVKIKKWENEFQAFYEIDINKPAFIGKYSSDTTWQEKEIKGITYKAKDQKLKVKWVKIVFDTLENKVQSIEALMEANNTLYQSTQVLQYYKNRNYAVKGTQKIRFLSPDNFEVQGTFIK